MLPDAPQAAVVPSVISAIFPIFEKTPKLVYLLTRIGLKRAEYFFTVVPGLYGFQIPKMLAHELVALE